MAWGSLVTVVAIVMLFLSYFYRSYFNSDDAVVNMLAESIWQQGRVLPHGWINNNGDLMVPSGALIIAPLLRWFPNGFALHGLVGVLATVVLLGSWAWLMQMLGIPGPVTLFVTTLVASGFSLFFAQMVFAQATYFWWSAGFFAGAALICRHRRVEVEPVGRWARVVWLFALVFAISFANPTRVFLMMVLPLYAFDWVLRSTDDRSKIRAATDWRFWSALFGADDRLTVVGLGLAFALAALAYEMLKFLGITHAVYGAAGLYWGGWPSVLNHAATFYHGWFYYLGATEATNGLPPLLDPLWVLLRYGIAIALIGVGVIEVATLRKQKDVLRRGMTVAFVTAFVPVLLIFLLFEPLAVNKAAERYFTVPIYILVVLCAFRLRDMVRASERLTTYALAFAGIALVGLSAQRFLPMPTFGSGQFWQIRQTPHMRLADLLEREGLHWGYATWWNAGVVTVLTDSLVRVTPVDLADNGIYPFGYMVLNDWYLPDRWNGETFLALSHDQAGTSVMRTLQLVLGTPARTIDSPDYRVLVYGHNISHDFACASNASVDEPLAKGAPSPRLLSAELVADDGEGTPRRLDVRLRNDANVTIGGAGRYPMAVGIQLLDDEGRVSAKDWNHTLLPCPILPGAEASMRVVLPEAPPGKWKIRVDLVQEQVAWLGDWGVPPLHLPLAVGSVQSDAPAWTPVH